MLKKIWGLVAILIPLLTLGGCGVTRLSPIEDLEQKVQSIDYSTKKIVLMEPMIWLDSRDAESGIILPQGIYQLEAESGNYLYFAAPDYIEYRTLREDNEPDRRFLFGGLFLSKKSHKRIPAGAYYSISDLNKVHFWRLGDDFIEMEGEQWQKLF
ncbi:MULTISPECIES: hypothetical protein [Desulfosediminicola]|uniref:hypothetical protein n=1 Tax=Desulfosediminicola TaxID=2886823 RepID=UPI0010AC6A4B|nr:hypothetical protein [Desulfosediminicola ganghwensis]